MAVYTVVSDEALAHFLQDYDLGRPLALKGIAEGVENSNFLLHTERGHFLLTLYEKRVDAADLPFFLQLLDHLARGGIVCPQPIHRRDGGVIGRLSGRAAAIVTFLDGISVQEPTVAHCRAVGEALARMHAAGEGFAGQRANALSIQAWPLLLERVRGRVDEVVPGLLRETEAALQRIAADWPADLPRGIVHADLFPDNVLFLGLQVSGLIDFYFACRDYLAYDLAVCLNAWAFEDDGAFNINKSRAMIGAYRTLTAAERAALPILCLGASVRFMLTRLVDWLNVPPGALVAPKDPRDYVRRMRFHSQVTSARDYGCFS